MWLRDLHPNIKIRIAETMVSNTVGHMILPFMAIYLASRFGEAITGGLLIGLMVATVASGAYGGYFADKIGRKRMMLIAEIIRFVSFLMMAAFNSPWLDSAIVTYLMMILINISEGLAFPAAQAMLVDCSTPENRKLIYSLQYWSINFSLLIGGIVGGLFFKSHFFELLLGMCAASLFSMCLLTFFIHDVYTPKQSIPENEILNNNNVKNLQQQEQSGGLIANYMVVLRDKTFLYFLIASAFAMSLEHLTHTYTTVRLANDMPEQSLFAAIPWPFTVDGIEMVGILKAENALLVLILTVFVLKLFRRFQDKWILFIGVAITAVGFAFMSVILTPWMLIAGMLVATIGETMYVSVRQSIMAEIIPDENRGTYLAVSGLIGVVANSIGSFGLTLSAFCSDWVMAGMFVVLGLLSVIGFQVTQLRMSAAKGHPMTPGASIGNSH